VVVLMEALEVLLGGERIRAVQLRIKNSSGVR
jgi:hypothetical protein